MTLADDTVNWMIGNIVTLQLANAASGGLVSDAVAPAYDVAAGGVSDITAPIRFTGAANAPISHVVFNDAVGEWFRVPIVGGATAMNSDGLWDLDSAPLGNTENVIDPA